MKSSKKLSGLAKGMIVSAIIAAVALISAICFAVSMGTGVITQYLNNPNSFKEMIGNVEKENLILNEAEWEELKSYKTLVAQEDNAFSAESNTMTVDASVAEIKIVRSDTDEIKTSFSQFGRAGETSAFTLERNGMELRIIKNNSGAVNVLPSLIIYVPDDIEVLSITLSAGDIDVEGISLDTLQITNQCGHIEVKNSTVKNVDIENKGGDIELDEGFKCTGKLVVYNKVGDVDFTLPLDIKFKLDYRSDMGEVSLSEINAALFSISSNTTITGAEGTVESKNISGAQVLYDIYTQVGEIDFN